MFFSKLNGIILVYDCTNRKSYNNISRWIKELVQIDQSVSLRSQSVQESLGLEEQYSVPETLFSGSLSSNIAAVAASRAQQLNRSRTHLDSNFPSISASFSNSVFIVYMQLAIFFTKVLQSLPVLMIGNKLDLQVFLILYSNQNFTRCIFL